VQQLLSGDREHLIQSAQKLAEQVEHRVLGEAAARGLSSDQGNHPTHLLAAGSNSLKMMSSRGVAGPLALSLQNSLKSAWNSYNRALLVRPLATKIMTGVVGTIIGDGIAQYSSYRMALPAPTKGVKQQRMPPFQYDFPRLARLLIWTASFATPLAHYWFNFLDTRIMPSAPTSMRAVAAKLILDQGFMAPVGTSLFFMAMKVLEGQPERAIPEVRAKLWPVMLANWTVWPLANAINFALIPPSQRILYVNVLAIAWSAFMSHMANKPAASASTKHAHHTSHTQHMHGVNMRPLETASAGAKLS